MENDYHSPYDHRDLHGDQEPQESDHLNHYEAPPSMLVRNPSGSLYIPSDPLVGQTTLDSRLRFEPLANNHHLTLTASNHRLTSSPKSVVSCRSPINEKFSTMQQQQQQHARLLAGQTLGSGGTNGGSAAAGERSLVRRSSPNSSSQYSSSAGGQHWRMKKDLGNRCSWKFAAIFFILLSFILLSALIYTTASHYVNQSYEDAKACAIVDSPTAKDVQHSIDLKQNSGFQPDRSSQNNYHNNYQRSSLPPDGASFEHLVLGEKQSKAIPAYSFWNFQFYHSSPAYVEFTFDLPRGSSIGLYGRKNAVPTLTMNDIRDVVSGFRIREARDTSMMTLTKSESYYLDSGHWFMSLYNDNGQLQEVSFVARVAEELSTNCPRGCSGHGECVLGRCQCQTGFDGPDCGQSMCPVLCSGHGDYVNGECRCFAGWKGVECQLRLDECETADCNGRGQCVNGECECRPGFTGKACEKRDCPDPMCSGHGFCVDGTCVCRKGWQGDKCDQLDHEAMQCLPDCSGHGRFDLEMQKCICHGQWTGHDCSKERCNLDCGEHGWCESGRCVCKDGWNGPKCDLKECDKRCQEHGVCSNGTCLCTNGWNGRHCTLEGCPNNCNGHGQCKTSMDLEWECWCESGWFGKGCDIKLEQDCSDRLDNDKDGLTDCEDPECCENPVCQKSQLCHTVPQPIDILLRKHPPAATASFFERMKFIIEDKGMQSYVQRAGFNESLFWSQFSDRRAAVVRGQVVTPDGMGLIGVRVSTNLPMEGFTMTRDDGWFDLMVNGGGPVMLQFGRNPYPPLRLHIFVPWNEVVVLDPVVLGQRSSNSLSSIDSMVMMRGVGNQATCKNHDFDKMRPLVLATWKNGFQGQIPDESAILIESQSIQESLPLPGSDIHLVYHSSRAKGYLSIIQIQLTPADQVPKTLVKVHLKITIEGVVHQKVFEADPDLQYVYAWDRLNEYRQRVYGITTAMVKVGYEYSDCPQIVWDWQTTKLSGHGIAQMDIGTSGWQLSVQHRYNFHAGILQKGDGNTVYLKYKPQVVQTVMGDGEQRELDCYEDECSGLKDAQHLRLLGPKALAASPDGSIFVADYNLLRRIHPDGRADNLLKISSKQISYRYHLTHSVGIGSEQRQTVYISQPDTHQILRLKRIPDLSRNEDPISASELSNNFEIFVGNGDRCLPGDADRCGDGGRADKARLVYPKGIAVTPAGELFIADGPNIRLVDEMGIIRTVIGHQNHRSNWKPLPCDSSEDALVEEIELNWPTELAVSPLDGSLHFIDDNVIIRVTPDLKRLSILAGRPSHCRGSSSSSSRLATSTSLIEPQSLAFGPNGDLFVAESDSQRINRVRIITTDGKIANYAGQESKCNCLDVSCECFAEDKYLASTAKFAAISAISCSPDGTVYVADQGNLRIRSISSTIPPEKSDGVFEVPDPEAQELYIFNKFGQHVLTKDIMTSNVLYQMTYTQATSDGKLTSVTDVAGRKLTLMRDIKGRVSSIQTSNGRKYSLEMSTIGDLEKFECSATKFNVQFRYHGSTGLLSSKLDSLNKAYIYEYDDYGRLINAIFPTGEVLGLKFNLTSEGAAIQIIHDGSTVLPTTSSFLSIKDDSVSLSSNDFFSVAVADKTLTSLTSWSQKTLYETMSHPVIAKLFDPVMGDSFPMVGGQKTFLGNNLVNSVDWDYSLATNGHLGQMMGIRKTMKVNGEDLITIYFDKLQRREVMYTKNSKSELLEIRYDSSSRPIHIEPKGNVFATIKQSYDRFGHLTKWEFGKIVEEYEHDNAGRLIRVKGVDTLKYQYHDDFSIIPTRITSGSGGTFMCEHDLKDGGLRRIQTPRGHFHSFLLKPILGRMRFEYMAPWSEIPYAIEYDSQGRVLAKLPPSSGHEAVHLFYAHNGQLDRMVCGDQDSEMSYDEKTGLLESVLTRKGHGFEVKERNKYHIGLIKEKKIRYLGGSPALSNAMFRYQYDGNGRLSSTVVSIGNDQDSAQNQNVLSQSHNSNTGLLESIGTLKITRVSASSTLLEDVESKFSKNIELDAYANIRLLSYGVQNNHLWSVEILERDFANRVTRRRIRNSNSNSEEEQVISYNADGHLVRVELRGTRKSFNYRYDPNGNLISFNGVALGYDAGDRIEVINRDRVLYDDIGCVKRIGDHDKFLHDAAGRLVEHVYQDSGRAIRSELFYDHLNRLVAWHDSKGRVQQLFYSDPQNRHSVTHVHNPKSGLTQHLFYDHLGHLVGIQTDHQKIMVATDELGSPVMFFREDGSVIKEVHYSPFGRIISDSNPSMSMPIGFQGFLVLPFVDNCLLNLRAQRIYNTRMAQYLNPDWESLKNDIKSPHDLFIYRFHQNNPLTVGGLHYLTDIKSWASIFGFDLDKILESGKRDLASINDNLSQHLQLQVNSNHLKVISGMENTLDSAKDVFEQLSFVQKKVVSNGERRLILNGLLASQPNSFGEGFLLSVIDNQSHARVVEGVNPNVVQNIFQTVLNGSVFMDVSQIVSGNITKHFFAKQTTQQFSSDLDSVRRLSGAFEVSQRNLEPSDDKDLVVKNRDLILHVVYGEAMVAHRAAISAAQALDAKADAWAREKRLAQAGFRGNGDWTKAQRAELVMGHKVRGFEAVEVVQGIITDASNYFFVPSGSTGQLQQQRRRKSRHGKTRPRRY